jgi:integrase
MSRSAGIEVRHARACPAGNDPEARCRCRPSYRAAVWSQRDRKRLRKTFPSLAAARAWRQDAGGAVRRGAMRAPDGTTVHAAWKTLEADMESGAARTRSGAPYKPSATRSYGEAMRLRVLPSLGARKLPQVTHGDVQALVDRLIADGLDASTIRNTLLPLRVLYRRAIRRGLATVNPTSDLELPSVTGKRDRVATPAEAAELLAALPEADGLRALYGTAFYAGLRRGELLALEWGEEGVDLDTGILRVHRSWDPGAGVFVEPKSEAGKRDVPIASVLRPLLAAWRLQAGRREGLVFGDGSVPLDPRSVARRTATAWKRANTERAENELAPLEPIGLHEARHTYASTMLAAGVGARVVAELMGHADAGLVWKRYGHVLPGAEVEAVAAFDAYQASASLSARQA